MTHQEMIDVIQAHKDGKQIQFQAGGCLLWIDVQDNDPSWDFNSCNYRIKPEPRRFWLNVYPDTRIYKVHLSLQSATENKSKRIPVETIEVVEVLSQPPLSGTK